jgi:DedD protein
MAFFKLRKPSDAAAPGAAALAAATPAQSLEAIRRKATYRLIGAAVLVLAAVIGFPILLDSQPRPVPVDVRIEVPDKDKAKPLQLPVAPVAQVAPAKDAAPAVAAVPAPAAAPAPVAAPVAPPASAAPATPAAASSGKVQMQEEKPESARPSAQAPATRSTPPAASTASPPAPSPAAKGVDDGARAKALLEGAAPAAAAGGRFVVQVGAYADAAKLREVRQKLERAGLTTYTQVVDTKDGKRTRVRLGPFEQRSQAEAAASKVKGLSLDAAVLAL